MLMLASMANLRPKKFSNFCALTPDGAWSPMSFDKPCRGTLSRPDAYSGCACFMQLAMSSSATSKHC